MWASYKNTVSDALGLFFQVKLFKSLHLLGLLVLSKPGAQGEAGGVLPARSPGAEHSACTLRMEGKGPPPQGSPGTSAAADGQFPQRGPRVCLQWPCRLTVPLCQQVPRECQGACRPQWLAQQPPLTGNI